MFNRISGSLAIVILGLCVWLWGQSQMIDNLRAENQTQAQTIEQQQKANQQLIIHLEQERQAVEQQSALVAQFRRQAIDKKEVVRYVLKDNQCANQHLPNAVIEQLRK